MTLPAALTLAFSLAGATAQACVLRSLEDAATNGPLAAVTAEGTWQVMLNPGLLEGFCVDCPDQRSFMLAVDEIAPVDLSIIPDFLDGERAAFCTDVVQQGAGVCTLSERAPLGDYPGLTGVAEVFGEALYTDVVICTGYVLSAQVGGRAPSPDLSALSTTLRDAMVYLTSD